MFSEMSFLFNMRNGGNISDISKEYSDSEFEYFSTPEEMEKAAALLKDVNLLKKDKETLKEEKKIAKKDYNYAITNDIVVNNYIKPLNDKLYNTSSKNPYLQLLEDFNGINSSPSVKISVEDIAYLRDLGVFPINRMVILRRYDDGVVIPKDLNELKCKPKSTIIGWIKDDEILNYSISENWVTQGSDKMLHLLLNDILSNEFGIKLDQLVPIPAWSVGFVFGFLNQLGLTSFNQNNIPAGDPFVLKESLTRDIEGSGVKSTFNFKLETCFEQKYINGIDLTFATNEILNNINTMGTSDLKYIGNGNSQILRALAAANNSPTDIGQWANLAKIIISKFQTALRNGLSTLKADIENIYTKYVPSTEDKKEGEESSGQQQQQQQQQQPQPTGEKEEIKNPEPDKAKMKKATLSIDLWDSILSSADTIMQPILASTIAKYQWPIRGSLAMLTGAAITPWHITIGNPYAPILSMNNIKIDDLNVSMTGDMMYNDIPKFINIKIDISQGRNMGKNEISNSLFIKYKRTYTKSLAKK